MEDGGRCPVCGGELLMNAGVPAGACCTSCGQLFVIEGGGAGELRAVPRPPSQPSTTQSKQGGARVRLPPPLVFLGFILIGLGAHHLISPLSLPIGGAAGFALAGFVGVAGLALNVATHLLFKRSGQSPAPWKPSPSLIARGPYRFSRNPMYLSLVLLQAAIGIALDDLWIVVGCAPALIVVHYTAVLREEAYLSERFGESYERYRSTVRRYL